jgi:prostaglandin-H2 D-isomerase / glutathione transferase
LRLIGNTHELHPSEPFEAARHEAIMGSVEDVRARLGVAMRIADPAEKKAAREALASGYLKTWAADVERQIVGPFVGGPLIQVVDLKLFVVLAPMVSGTVEYIPFSTFDLFPKLNGLWKSVEANEKVAAFRAKHAAKAK